MNRFATVALSLLLMGAMAGPVFAQRTDVNPNPLGDLYVSNAPDQYNPVYQSIPQFAPVSLYLVADVDFGDIGQAGQNVSNGIAGWEASVTVPAGMSVLQATLTPSALNIGTSTATVQDYIVGLGAAPVLASTTPLPLVTLSVIVTAAIPDATMAIGPASLPTLPGESIWIEVLAANGCTNPVSGLARECFFIWANTLPLRVSTGIAVEENTWGGLKKAF